MLVSHRGAIVLGARFLDRAEDANVKQCIFAKLSTRSFPKHPVRHWQPSFPLWKNRAMAPLCETKAHYGYTLFTRVYLLFSRVEQGRSYQRVYITHITYHSPRIPYVCQRCMFRFQKVRSASVHAKLAKSANGASDRQRQILQGVNTGDETLPSPPAENVRGFQYM